MKKYLDITLTILLFIIVVVLSFKYSELEKEYELLLQSTIENRDTFQNEVIIKDKYLDLYDVYNLLQLRPFPEKKPTKVKNSRVDGFTVVILLDVDDCGACFAEKILWEEMYNLDDKLSVVAVISGENQSKVEYLLRMLDVEIPFFYDQNGEFVNQLGLKVGIDTPIKLVLNHETKIIDSSRTLYGNRDAHLVYLKALKELVNS